MQYIYEYNRDDSSSQETTNRTTSQKVIVKVTDLKKNFGRKHKLKEVLKGINFEINEGENVAIIGANGAGKTTLVEILAGLNKPTSGKIDYTYEYNKNYLEQIGIQFQDSSYPVGIAVNEVIQFMINVYGLKMPKEELDELIKIFGIDEFYKKSAYSLSGGQQQRLNAILAVLHKPKIAFLDELSTGLDIRIRTKIKEFIKNFAKLNNMTIVIVSHDMDEVQYLADRIIVIQDGKIAENITKQDLLRKYGSVQQFVTHYI